MSRWPSLGFLGRLVGNGPTPGPLETDHPSLWGLAALSFAELEIGNGEDGANNVGVALARYRNGGPGGPWCAAFVYYCILRAWAQRERCPIERSHNAKELFRRIVKVGREVSEPQRGDVALWTRGAADSRKGHIAFVRHPVVEGVWQSLDGNRGTFPSKVRPYPHELGEAGFLGWARLP